MDLGFWVSVSGFSFRVWGFGSMPVHGLERCVCFLRALPGNLCLRKRTAVNPLDSCSIPRRFKSITGRFKSVLGSRAYNRRAASWGPPRA